MNPSIIRGLLLVLLACTWQAAAWSQEDLPLPQARELVEQLRNDWSGADLELSAGMTIVTPGKKTKEADVVIMRDDRGRVRLEFMKPEKDEGKIILTIDGETWLYLPRADRTVKVPAGKNMLAGGILMDDLFHGEIAYDDAAVELVEGELRLEFASGRGRKKSRSVVYLDRDSHDLLRREIYNRSGKLLRSVEIQESTRWRSWSVPSRVLYRDMLRKGMETVIEVTGIRSLTDESRALLSLDALKQAAGTGGESDAAAR